MTALRSKHTQEKYDAYRAAGNLDRGCVLCKKEAIRSFAHWRIVPNDFPYDNVARAHHILIPIRHTDERGFTEDERLELAALKETYLNDHYDYVIEATRRKVSIPQHFHLHLIVEDA